MEIRDNLEDTQFAKEFGRLSFLQKILGVFWNPVQTMRAISRQPSCFYPVLWIGFFCLIQSLLILPILEDIVNRELVVPLGHNEEIARKHVVRMAKTINVLGGVLGPLLMCMILASILWLWGKYVGKADFNRLFSVTLFGFMPKILIGGFINATLLVIGDVSILKRQVTSLGVFLPEKISGSLIGAFLNNIDVITIWSLSLVGIGSAIAMEVSFRRVIIPLFMLWAVFISILAILKFVI